jgi:phosphoribosylformylglycinamidine synthase
MHDDVNYALYRALSDANKQQLCASAIGVGFGGVGVTLAKKAIAGRFGLDITLSDALRFDKMLYSESQGRIVVTVAPQDKDAFEKTFSNYNFVQQIGTVTDKPVLKINKMEVAIDKLEEAYKALLRDY